MSFTAWTRSRPAAQAQRQRSRQRRPESARGNSRPDRNVSHPTGSAFDGGLVVETSEASETSRCGPILKADEARGTFGCGLVAETSGSYGGGLAAEPSVSCGGGLVAEPSESYGGDLARRARRLDRELLQLARDDSAARRVLGRLAGRFIEVRGCERLGFARLGDYATERLGWSGRQLQEITRVASTLAGLPASERAFRSGTLSWSKARLLALVATANDETKWLAVATATTVRALAAVTSSARAAAREERRLAATQLASAARTQSHEGSSDGAVGAAADHGPMDEDEEEHEERVLVRILCSRHARRTWNDARRYAARMAGRALAQWEVAELVAAEASSAPGPFYDLWQQEPWRSFAATRPRDDQRRARSPETVAADPSPPPAPSDPAPVFDERIASADSQTTIQAAEEPDRAASPSEADFSASVESESTSPIESEFTSPLGESTSPIESEFTSPLDSEFTSPVEDNLSSASEWEFASPMEAELARLEELDAFELDAAMRRVRRAMQQRQSHLGTALGLFLDLRLHDQLGYACGADYVRERLGIPDRTARELVRVAQAAERKSPVLASAYARGELSWLRALTLLSVVRAANATAWVTRAGEVTLRRLADEVAWAVERADRDPAFHAAMPPPPGQDLGLGIDNREMHAPGSVAGHATGRAGDDRQMCAHDTHAGGKTNQPAQDDRQMCAPGSVADKASNDARDEFWGVTGRIHVTFVAPVSVSTLFRSTMQSFASPTEPRWKAFERMLHQVLAQWRSQPRHRDPVFARDGHRCSAPGCSSLTNLHDHHIVARSAGGTNEMGNRTTLCAWHHLRAVHGGLARATGQAPDAIDWELGLSTGRPPLMRLHGERYLHEQA